MTILCWRKCLSTCNFLLVISWLVCHRIKADCLYEWPGSPEDCIVWEHSKRYLPVFTQVLEKNHRKLRTSRSINSIRYYTRHLEYTSFETITSRSRVGAMFYWVIYLPPLPVKLMISIFFMLNEHGDGRNLFSLF